MDFRSKSTGYAASPRNALAIAIMFIAPSGMFFIPFADLGSFRLFYFLLPFFSFFSLGGIHSKRLVQLALLLIIFTVLLASSAYAIEIGSGDITSPAKNPIIRALVIGNLMFGFYFISVYVAGRGGEYLLKLIHMTYYGFVVVFVLGSLLYFLYVSGRIGLTTYARFTSLYQEAYGYVRLSPGTYPNEFGIISSFYAVYALASYGENRKRIYLLGFFAFAVGVFLTTTRAAYITLFFGVSTLVFFYSSTAAKIKYLVYIALGIIVSLAVMGYFNFNIFEIISTGFDSIRDGSGSVEARNVAWSAAMADFEKKYLFGVGFESPPALGLHNLPLQISYGLGIVPLVLVIAVFSLFYLYSSKIASISSVYFSSLKGARFARMVRVVLFEHVFLFGLTNHNQAHFFTWFLFMLTCLSFKKSSSDVAGRVSSNAGNPVVA